MRTILVLLLYLAASSCLQAQKLNSEQIEKFADAQFAKAISDFRTLLSIPNDAHFHEDIKKNIAWMQEAFTKRNFEVELLETEGEIPIMLASNTYPKAGKTVLIYLQADGQPVDKTKWFQEHPFTPVLKAQDESGNWEIIDWNNLDGDIDEEWRVFARAAADAKGPIIMFLAA